MDACAPLKSLALALVMWCWAAAPLALELTPQEQAGRQLFREGRSASGGEVHALIGPGATPLPATVMPCASCHGSDGTGRSEGGAKPPDISWRRLSTPYGRRLSSSRSRPPYDEATFARAVSHGLDPAGNPLDPVMPRFVMSARDMASLTAYIKRLEQDRDPGLLPELVRIGTLLPAAGPLADIGRTVAALLQAEVARLNAEGGIHGRRIELVVADPGASGDSARAALQGLIDETAVFALLAPLAPALEAHYAELLAAPRLPLIGPLVQAAADSRSPLIFEPLPGLAEQLFALAGFAAGKPGSRQGNTFIVHVDDPHHLALATRLSSRLARSGWARVEGVAWPMQGDRPADFLADADTLFYIGPADGFVALAQQVADADGSPRLLAASSQVAAAALALPQDFAGSVFLAYPFLPGDWSPAGRRALGELQQRAGLNGSHLAMQIGAYSSLQVLAEGLRRAGRDASREKLVRELERLQNFRTGLTPPLGFGPGQRIGSPAAHIVAVDLRQRRFEAVGSFVRAD